MGGGSSNPIAEVAELDSVIQKIEGMSIPNGGKIYDALKKEKKEKVYNRYLEKRIQIEFGHSDAMSDKSWTTREIELVYCNEFENQHFTGKSPAEITNAYFDEVRSKYERENEGKDYLRNKLCSMLVGHLNWKQEQERVAAKKVSKPGNRVVNYSNTVDMELSNSEGELPNVPYVRTISEGLEMFQDDNFSSDTDGKRSFSSTFDVIVKAGLETTPAMQRQDSLRDFEEGQHVKSGLPNVGTHVKSGLPNVDACNVFGHIEDDEPLEDKDTCTGTESIDEPAMLRRRLHTLEKLLNDIAKSDFQNNLCD